MYQQQLKVQNPSHKTYTIQGGKVVMQKKNWSANMIIIHFLALYAWLVLSTVDKKEVPTCAYLTSAAFPLHLLFNSKEMEMQKVDNNYSISHLDQQPLNECKEQTRLKWFRPSCLSGFSCMGISPASHLLQDCINKWPIEGQVEGSSAGVIITSVMQFNKGVPKGRKKSHDNQTTVTRMYCCDKCIGRNRKGAPGNTEMTTTGNNILEGAKGKGIGDPNHI